MKVYLLVLFLLATITVTNVRAQTTPAANDEQSLKEIGELRAGLIDAFNKQDIDRAITYLHPNVVVTWQNAEVSHGPAEVKAYYQRMMVGQNSIVESITVNPVVEGRDIIGNTSISYGAMNDEFKLRDGMEFKMNSRFSAALVKENGHWLVLGFHLSGNLFDNEIQNLIVRRVAWWTGGIAGVAALLIGFIAGRVTARSKSKAAAG